MAELDLQSRDFLPVVFARAFAWGLAVLLFVSYPLALVPPGLPLDTPWVRWGLIGIGLLGGIVGTLRSTSTRARALAAGSGLLVALGVALLPTGFAGDAHYLPLPSMLLASLLAVPLLASVRWTTPRWFQLALIVFLLGCLLQLNRVADHLAAEKLVAFAGYALVPLAVAVAFHQDILRVEHVTRVVTALWACLVVYGLLQYFLDREVIGLALNRNWMATALVATTPWALWQLHRSSPVTWRRPRTGTFLAAIMLALSLFLVWRCFSRAAWLALMAYGFWFLLGWLGKWRWRVALLLLTFLLAAMLPFVAREKLRRVHEQDVRLPLWQATLLMTLKHPLRGVGPAAYEREQTRALSGSGYHRRLHATPRTEHPHNELLNVAANLGWPAALAWIVMLAAVVRFDRDRPIWERLARFTAFVCVVHGMLDKTLIQPPTNLLAWGALGLLWVRHVHVTAVPARWLNRRVVRVSLGVLCVALLAWGLWAASRDVRYGWHTRRGHQYRRSRRYESAVEHFRQAYQADRRRPAAPYAVAVLLLEQLDRPDAALTWLATVYDLNPAYGNVNRLVAKSHLVQGRLAEALGFAQQEVALQPYDTASLQLLYTCFALAGEYGPLPAIQLRLREMYAHLAVLFRQPARRLSRGNDWREAMQQEDFVRAARIASNLPPAQLSASVTDPPFFWLTEEDPWPPEVVFGKCAPIDAWYWEWSLTRLALIAELVGQDLATREGGPPPAALVHALRQYLRVLAELPYRLPHEVMATGEANVLAGLCTVAWLLDLHGWNHLLYVPEGEAPQLVVFREDAAWRIVGFQDEPRVTRLPDDPREWSDLLPADFAEAARQFHYAQAYWLRSQVAAVILQAYGVEDAASFERVPLLRLLAAREVLAAAGMQIEPRQAFLRQPLERCRELLVKMPRPVDAVAP